MLNFLLFILSGVGITNIIVNASILDNIREYLSVRSSLVRDLTSCMLCSGFWVGLILGFYFDINCIISGGIISLLSFVFDYFIDYLEVSTAVKSQELNN